jgi:hypothetical protein
MNKIERQPFLDAVDHVLIPLGFKRRKTDFEWKRKSDNLNEEWVHLNFGLGVINPSYGVTYLELSEIMPREISNVSGVFRMLKSTTGRNYDLNTEPINLSDDIATFCLNKLLKLRNRKVIIEVLQNDNAMEWPCSDYSARMRLLPLLLFDDNKIKECSDWLEIFEQQSAQKDQLIPTYDIFSNHLKAKINQTTF